MSIQLFNTVLFALVYYKAHIIDYEYVLIADICNIMSVLYFIEIYSLLFLDI